MFDHVTIRVSDRDASRRFYDTVLSTLGYSITNPGAHFEEWNDFGISTDGQPVTRGLHVGFVARSREEVDRFWRTGVDAGYASDGEPGLRPEYAQDYYGSFLLDPDGNSVEAVTGLGRKDGGNFIDHLWIRVADLDASRRFYATIAPVLGLRTRDAENRVFVSGGDRSFSLVRDERPTTQNVHLAFGVADDDAVREFHRVATAAGFRDNGAPGERAHYHPGYYGAFVLDPDGNNVEAVNHKR